MRKRIACMMMVLLCGVGPWAHAAPAAAQGLTPPARIVSLKPNLTEILFAIGAGERVVGVSTWCDVPAAARRLPKVADYLQPNLEAILQLRPDVIFTSTENSLRAPVEQLQRLGLRVEVLAFATVAETLASIERIGRLVDAPIAATQLATHLRNTIARYAATPLHPRPRVLLLVARAPLIAAGPSSLLGELLTMAGGRNVLTARAPAYPRLSDERVLALRPDVVIDAEPMALFRPGPRLGEGLHLLRSQLLRPSAAARPESP